MIKRAAAGALIAVLVGFVCVNSALAAEQRSLGLSATKFGFAAEPGQTGTGEVFVSNEGSAPVSVRVYVVDQVIAADGSASFVAPALEGSQLNSPASWVTLELPPNAKFSGNTPYIELAPGRRQPVKFNVKVPKSAAPGDRQAVLFFETISPQGADQGASAQANARIGARIETRVKGEIVENPDVRPFSMPGFVVGSSPGYSFTVRNDGNIDERVSARLVVLDGSENELSSSAVMTDTAVYAGTTLHKNGTLQLPGLGIGPTQVRLVVSYTGASGVAKSIQKDRTLWALPLWLLLMLAALFVALVLAGVWAVGRRAAKRKAA